jgi:hypothetical protein
VQPAPSRRRSVLPRPARARGGPYTAAMEPDRCPARRAAGYRGPLGRGPSEGAYEELAPCHGRSSGSPLMSWRRPMQTDGRHHRGRRPRRVDRSPAGRCRCRGCRAVARAVHQPADRGRYPEDGPDLHDCHDRALAALANPVAAMSRAVRSLVASVLTDRPGSASRWLLSPGGRVLQALGVPGGSWFPGRP